jgi:SET domain-containing protein
MDYPLCFSQTDMMNFRERIALSIINNCTIDDEKVEEVENLSSSKKDQCLRGCKFTMKAKQIVSKSKWGKDIDSTQDCLNNMNESVECDKDCKGGSNCPNKRIQMGLWKKFETNETQGSGKGLFLMEDVRKGDFIIEYVGKIVHKSPKSVYGMRFTEVNLWIDGSKTKSPAKFMNHSCEPNCKLEQWAVDGLPRMCFFAIEDILSGDELTFDYNWELKATKEALFKKSNKV